LAGSIEHETSGGLGGAKASQGVSVVMTRHSIAVEHGAIRKGKAVLTFKSVVLVTVTVEPGTSAEIVFEMKLLPVIRD